MPSFLLVMHETAARSLRTAERFLLEPPILAQFGAAPVAVCDISAKGARFRHGQPLEMGQKSVLRLAIDGRPMPLTLEAVVVWTQLDSMGKGKFVSGVRTYASAELVDGMLGHLRQTRRANRIADPRRARAQARAASPPAESWGRPRRAFPSGAGRARGAPPHPRRSDALVSPRAHPHRRSRPPRHRPRHRRPPRRAGGVGVPRPLD